MDKHAAQLTTPSPEPRGKKIMRYILYAFCAAVVAVPICVFIGVYRDMADLGVASAGVPHVEDLGIRDGTITFTPAQTHTRGNVTWTPMVEGRTLNWHCSAIGFGGGQLPAVCRRPL
jgi:hypothetical protein